jgi:hypothetical protein
MQSKTELLDCISAKQGKPLKEDESNVYEQSDCIKHKNWRGSNQGC